MNSIENPEFLLNSKLLTVLWRMWALEFRGLLMHYFFPLTFNVDICIRKQKLTPGDVDSFYNFADIQMRYEVQCRTKDFVLSPFQFVC